MKGPAQLPSRATSYLRYRVPWWQVRTAERINARIRGNGLCLSYLLPLPANGDEVRPIYRASVRAVAGRVTIVRGAMLHAVDALRARCDPCGWRRWCFRSRRSCSADTDGYQITAGAALQNLMAPARAVGKAKYLDVPMSHQDIANHLGFTIGAVSRAITDLERSG